MSEIQQGLYSGDSDLRLEWISFYYYGEARDGSCVPPAGLMTLKPGAVRSLRSGPPGQMIFRSDNCLFGLSTPTDDAEGRPGVVGERPSKMSGIQQGLYSGDSDLRLEWISFYYHSKARDGSRLPPTVLTTLKPEAVRSLCSGPLGQRIFRPDNCLFGLSIPTDDVEGAESIRLRLQQGKNSDCLQGGSYLSLHVCTLGECTGPMQK